MVNDNLTLSHKLCYFFVSTSAICLLGIPTLGLLYNDLAGYAFFTALFACTITIIFFFLSLTVPVPARKTLVSKAWLAYALLSLLILAARIYYQLDTEHLDDLALFMMMILSFPAGLVTFFIYEDIAHLDHGLMFSWALAFSAGYIQWFWLLPALKAQILKSINV